MKKMKLKTHKDRIQSIKKRIRQGADHESCITELKNVFEAESFELAKALSS